MKVYRTDEIRNVVLLGHGGSGKTSLAEAMLYVSGAVSRMGKISESNTTSDFDKEEQKRGFSISTSLIPIEWEKAKINILDTPGYFDFVGEVEEAVSAADAAVIVVSGKAGVQVGTEKAWELCDKYNLPRMVYVTEMDMDDASFRQVVEDLTVRYGKKIAPHFQPIRENEKLVGYINIIKNAGRRYTGIGQREECEIPDYCLPNLKILRDSLMEAVAETSEEFMDRYFEGDKSGETCDSAEERTDVMEIGVKLKEARIKSGLTQENVAEKIQVSRQTISNWENEKSFPDIVNVIKLSDLYNISLDQLLKGDEAMIEHLEKSTNIVKSNEKLIAAIIANVLLMILFILFNGLIIENHYLIMGSSILGITATCMLFYQIIKKL